MRVFFFYTIAFIIFLSLVIFFRFYLGYINVAYFLMRLVIVSEFIFLSIFYYYLLKNSKKRVFFTAAIILFIIYSFYDYHSGGRSDFSYSSLVVECLFFLVVIPYYLYEKMQYSISTPIYQSPDFWISFGFLIYYSGNFFLFIYSKVMFSDPRFAKQYNIQFDVIYDCFTLLKDFLLCIAIFVNNSTDKSNKQFNVPISIDLDIYKKIN
jgi:hypothetical protein